MGRSPIEMMVDAACGFDRSKPAPPKGPQVWIECPTCGSRKEVDMHETDPPRTYRVVSECPKCSIEGTFEEVNYFDRAGNQLAPD